MKNLHTDPEKQTREWMKESGLEKPSDSFTQLVMEKVETKKRLYPYKKDSNIWNYILGVGLPLAYLLYQYFSGSASLPAGATLQHEVQPYIHVFQLILEKVSIDMSTPIVPLGMGAIVLLLAFDRIILRPFSFNR